MRGEKVTMGSLNVTRLARKLSKVLLLTQILSHRLLLSRLYYGSEARGAVNSCRFRSEGYLSAVQYLYFI